MNTPDQNIKGPSFSHKQPGTWSCSFKHWFETVTRMRASQQAIVWHGLGLGHLDPSQIQSTRNAICTVCQFCYVMLLFGVLIILMCSICTLQRLNVWQCACMQKLHLLTHLKYRKVMKKEQNSCKYVISHSNSLQQTLNQKLFHYLQVEMCKCTHIHAQPSVLISLRHVLLLYTQTPRLNLTPNHKFTCNQKHKINCAP